LGIGVPVSLPPVGLPETDEALVLSRADDGGKRSRPIRVDILRLVEGELILHGTEAFVDAVNLKIVLLPSLVDAEAGPPGDFDLPHAQDLSPGDGFVGKDQVAVFAP
jgi:hypothetical protein